MWGAAGRQAAPCALSAAQHSGRPPPSPTDQVPHLHGVGGGVGLREVEGAPGQEGEGGGQREVELQVVACVVEAAWGWGRVAVGG